MILYICYAQRFILSQIRKIYIEIDEPNFIHRLLREYSINYVQWYRLKSIDSKLITEFDHLEVVPLLPKDLAKIYDKVAAGFERKFFFESKERNQRIYVQILWNENKTTFKLKFEREVDGHYGMSNILF